MKRFLEYITEAEALPRSKDVKVRPMDRRHKRPNAITVMFAKHTKHKRGDEAYDYTIVEPKGSRNYKGTVSKLRDEKGQRKQGWVAGVEGKRGRKVEIGIGTTNSGNDLLAIRKAYEKAAKALGQVALTKSVPMIPRGNALAKRIS